jgi:hypothetical protein
MRRDRSSRATRRPFYRSTGQAISRHGKADEKTFGLPFPRDVSPSWPATVARTRRSPKTRSGSAPKAQYLHSGGSRFHQEVRENPGGFRTSEISGGYRGLARLAGVCAGLENVRAIDRNDFIHNRARQ